MQIRKYRPSDCRELAELFYDTVHTVNAGDYTKEQLDAWATGHVDLEAWDRSFREHHTLVALEDGAVIGFGDIDGSGYLDRLYVHRRHQGKGVATALCDRLEPEQRETKQRGQHNCRKPPGGGRHHPVRFHRIPPECIEFRAFCD